MLGLLLNACVYAKQKINLTRSNVDYDSEEDVDDDNLEYHNTIILKFDFIEVSSFERLKRHLKHLIHCTLSR